ncbi:RES family NAD+ phosphorylase [Siphonobacter sp. SORGH_AS_0500]|uniref:RES family NAD+ phosphorylase n=1 Tax=Siphonobacter sp. SORGH_AS_0500 TaxID=1864824 RepID=UPI0018E3BA1E|nr:RES family NAD+ phosphorylase [Siphonobacter sp. SORGH_AS_0500]
MKEIIKSQSATLGNCDFCETQNIIIINCHELSDHFNELFELYTNFPNSINSLKIDRSVNIHEHLTLYWTNLFNRNALKIREIKHLIDQIGRGSRLYTSKLFSDPVEISSLIEDLDGFESNLLRWDIFCNEIKYTNRFFLNTSIDTDKLSSIFQRLASTYPIGTIFYRARISDNLLKKSELGKPPKEKTTPGRANPVGIPYLYVSESERTTLYETRVALHEGISIGKFILVQPLNLISLKDIYSYGPFEILDKGFTLEEFIQFRPYLQKLSEELSKPVRKQDVHLDYLPTQYLCEFIKSSLGFDAIEYKSSMNSIGYNLAIFNDSKLACSEVNFYIVKDLEYSWE